MIHYYKGYINKSVDQGYINARCNSLIGPTYEMAQCTEESAELYRTYFYDTLLQNKRVHKYLYKGALFYTYYGQLIIMGEQDSHDTYMNVIRDYLVTLIKDIQTKQKLYGQDDYINNPNSSQTLRGAGLIDDNI